MRDIILTLIYNFSYNRQYSWSIEHHLSSYTKFWHFICFHTGILLQLRCIIDDFHWNYDIVFCVIFADPSYTTIFITEEQNRGNIHFDDKQIRKLINWNFQAAEKAYKFYNKHRLETHARDCTIQFESLKTLAKEVREEPKLTLDDICRLIEWLFFVIFGSNSNSQTILKAELFSVQVRYAMFQAVMFGLLQCLSAHFTFLTYGSKIIEQSGTHLSSEVSSISMALVQMFATFVTFVLIDRKGRKFLLIISLVGCALGHGAMIAYLYLHNNGFDTSMFHWTPIICMSSIILAASIGIIPLTFICMAEMFPPKTRSFGLTFGTAVLNIILFLITKAFPVLMEAIGLQGCLMIFCVSCTFGTLFAILFVEETKGKDLNMINEAQLPRNESFVAK